MHSAEYKPILKEDSYISGPTHIIGPSNLEVKPLVASPNYREFWSHLPTKNSSQHVPTLQKLHLQQ